VDAAVRDTVNCVAGARAVCDPLAVVTVVAVFNGKAAGDEMSVDVLGDALSVAVPPPGCESE